jgi:two-component system sensor histidine kinase BarA
MLGKTYSIKADVRRLIFIPSVSLIVLISITLTYLCIEQLGKFIDLRANTLVKKTAHLLHKPLMENNAELAQHIVAASLEDPYIRAVEAYDAIRNVRYHAGPSFMPSTDPGEANSVTPGKRETSRSIRFSQPLVDMENKNSIGWVEIEMMSSPYLVFNYEAIILTITLSLLCLIMVAFFSIRLYQRITTPLAIIQNTLDKLIAGDYQSRVPDQQAPEFNQVAISINRLTESMQAAHQDMQAHIDQAIDDLNETMETLESQNVELDIARKEALEASRIKSEFLANTSHEIRTPLNSILGFVNLILKSPLNEEQKQQLETIRDSAMHLQTVMNGILDFSKIASGKLTLDYALLPIRKLVDEVTHTFAPEAHEKNLQIITLMDNRIPKHLLGDGLRFKQVLSALVTNAIKYSHAGNIKIQITPIEQLETQITLQISVADQGIGLTPEEQKPLFSPFNQVDGSTNREHEGLGMSLALCKKLVERMHGNISVVSEKNKGSTFIFTARFGIEKRQPEAIALSNLNKYKILICGENIDSLEQFRLLLSEWNNTPDLIAAIHDCFPAMKAARLNDALYDLMILDISPNERKIPPVLLSNLADQLKTEFNCQLVACCTPAHQRLFKTYSDNQSIIYLNKPVSHQEFYQLLCSYLEIDYQAQDNNLLNIRKVTSVLLVDDNPANLQFTTELLTVLNSKVRQASSGQQAIQACEEDNFDVIFMDIQMPGMDGIEATRRIRQLESGKKRTPIIALTAHSITEQKSELLIAGMDDCLSKPVSEAQLIHVINRWASLSGKKEIAIKNIEPNTTEANIKDRITEPNTANSSVDIALCLKLSNNKPALARDMLKMLIAGIAEEKQLIMDAMQDNNFEQAGEVIHKLYGSSCYCGVPRLKYISGLIDKLFQKKLYAEATSAIGSLYMALDDVLEWQKGKNIDELFGLAETVVL